MLHSYPQVDFRVRSLEVVEGCEGVHLVGWEHGSQKGAFPFQDVDLHSLRRVGCGFEPSLWGCRFSVKLENRGRKTRRPVIRAHILGREPVMALMALHDALSEALGAGHG